MLIYYLDDEKELCDVFKEYIESSKLIVKVFNCANQFLKEIELNAPNLVVIDYRLKKETGDEVAKKIGIDIPKILVTGELNPPSVNGFNEIIKKPYRLANVQDTIEKYLL